MHPCGRFKFIQEKMGSEMMLDMISRITRLHKKDNDFDEKLREILFELYYEIERLKERETLK